METRALDGGWHPPPSSGLSLILGSQLINSRIVGNSLLALVTGLPIERRSPFGRLPWNRTFMRASWRVGAVCCVGAVALNYQTIAQYVTRGAIDVHWSYIITGAALFLVGAQLCMAGGLLGIFGRVAEPRGLLE